MAAAPSVSSKVDPDHNESQSPPYGVFPIDPGEAKGRRAKAPPPAEFTDDEAARLAWRRAKDRKPVDPKRHRPRLNSTWGEIVEQAVDNGEEGIEHALAILQGQGSPAHEAARAALQRTRPKMKRVKSGLTDHRPKIEINTDRHIVRARTIEAMAADPNLFYRGEALVTVIREDANLVHLTTKTTVENVAGSPKIVVLDEAVIGTTITEFAEFYAWKVDRFGEEGPAPAHPPDWLIRGITRAKHWRGIRPLVAVAECPYPRPDGSIVEEPGYDAPTAILYAPSLSFPKLPAAPTRDDARECWQRIRQFVRFYPFKSPDDEVVFLAGLLGVICRHGVIGPMPGIAVSGNKPGTGKGYLVNGMVIPGTGRVAPMSKYPHDEIEAGKVKTAIVLSGKTIASFDNLSEGSTYGGADIDSLITGKVTDDRILGGSRNTGDLIVRLVCFVNGNNIEPVKDAYRRWLVCNLETQLEHPERRDDIRDDDGNPLPEPDVIMLDNRVAIVTDALTILKAHAAAGWPTDGWPPLGSFDHWDKVVRGAVWFATGLDCTKTQEVAAETNSERNEKVALLEGISELPEGIHPGGKGLTCAEMIRAIEMDPTKYETLLNALIAKGRSGKPVDSNQLGKILRGLVNSPMGGWKLIKHPTLRHKVAAWLVEKVVEPDRGGWGVGGLDSSHLADAGNLHNYIIKSGENRQASGVSSECAPPGPHPPLDLDDLSGTF